VSFPKARANGWRNAGVVGLIWLQCWRNNQGAARRLLEKILCMDFHLRARVGRRSGDVYERFKCICIGIES
jgi:hypothetical protein